MTNSSFYLVLILSTSDKKKANFKQFKNRIKEAVDCVKDAKETILCISHIDADGLTSAGIIGRALHRENILYQIRGVRQLELPIIGEIAKMKNARTIIFSDLGAGQIEGINKYLADRDIIILDHHPVITEPASESILNVTPFDFGYDGVNEVSGAGVAYFFAEELDPINIDSSAIAIVGALGDRQDQGKKNSLISLNRKIVEDGIKAGVLEEKLDIRLFGRETRPIHQALEYTTDPFLPGLTGNGDMCNRFMRDTGIPQQKGKEWRSIQDLSKDERVKLVEALIKYGLKHGMSAKESQNILGNVYILTQEEPGTLLRDAREFGSLLNSCGRLGATGVAIGICMGERRFLVDEAEEIMRDYRRKISNYLQLIYDTNEYLKEYANIVVFDGRDVVDDTIIGTVISIAISSKKFLEKKKPLIGLANSEDGTVKVSSRGSAPLIQKGLHLGDALREAVESIGSSAEGGGHNIAAGARIPQGTEAIFIEALNTAVEKQLIPEQKKTEQKTDSKQSKKTSKSSKSSSSTKKTSKSKTNSKKKSAKTKPAAPKKSSAKKTSTKK
jgi:RecJ-like exonuclease